MQPQDVTSHLHLFGSNTRTIQATGNDQVIMTNKNAHQRWSFPAKGTKAWGHRQIDKHFIQCILHGTKPLVTPDDAIAAQQVATRMVETPFEDTYQVRDTLEIIAIGKARV